jgi:hypothetical protein
VEGWRKKKDEVEGERKANRVTKQMTLERLLRQD